MSLFQLSTPALVVGLFAVIIGATVVGHLIGRSMRDRSEGLREPFGAIQSAMLGFMALVMAFGLSLAVGRYESRRAAVVTEANALGTAYLRAQTLAEPNRTPSLEQMRRLTDASIDISETVPGSPEQQTALAEQRRRPARSVGPGRSGDDRPADRERAPPLPGQPQRGLRRPDDPGGSGLGNRVPTPVLLLEMVGAALALGLLALHLGTLGRGPGIALLAAVLVASTLFITFDLDRPVRGLINVPADPLTTLRTSMDAPPAYGGPT